MLLDMACPVTALSATSAWAESPLQSFSAVRTAKAAGAKAVKEKCAPASHLSDNDFANKVLATDGNKNAVRGSNAGEERNNQKATSRNRQNRLSGQIAVISSPATSVCQSNGVSCL